MPELAATSFKKNAGFVARNIAGELVLIPIAKELREVNSIYSMNAMGARIWELLEEERSFQKIKKTLLSEYEVEEVKLEEDLTEIINQLTEIKAIQAL